jgi:hypothetical protein
MLTSMAYFFNVHILNKETGKKNPMLRGLIVQFDFFEIISHFNGEKGSRVFLNGCPLGVNFSSPLISMLKETPFSALLVRCLSLLSNYSAPHSQFPHCMFLTLACSRIAKSCESGLDVKSVTETRLVT